MIVCHSHDLTFSDTVLFNPDLVANNVLIFFLLKIDMKTAHPDNVSKQMEKLFDVKQNEILRVS